MKKSLLTLSAALLVAAVTGCAQGLSPVTGIIFTEVSGPLAATHTGGSKMGTATCTSILGALASGDCSIAAAKKNGGISSVSSVDYKTKSILGFYAETTTVVRGS